MGLRATLILLIALTFGVSHIGVHVEEVRAESRHASKKKRPACSDRKDNDRDGKRDYPRDPGCKSRRDNSERDPRPTPTPTAPSDSDPQISTGVGVSLNGKRIFPANNPWNEDISSKPVDRNSATLIASIGLNTGLHPDFGTFWEGQPIGFSYVVVSSSQPKVSIAFDYADESDSGPYPIPLDAPIEGGPSSDGDRHILTIDRDAWVLYETYDSHRSGNGWSCGSGAIFDLNSNQLRPAGWTSADAAGLPIFPGLVRYDEVAELGEITHALRFTAQRTRRAYVSPARHYASSNSSASLPPMGMRVRLKASVDISRFSPHLQVILRALKKYGMFLADNGSNWYISGTHDTRWNDDELSEIRQIKGSDFEVVEMSSIVTQ